MGSESYNFTTVKIELLPKRKKKRQDGKFLIFTSH